MSEEGPMMGKGACGLEVLLVVLTPGKWIPTVSLYVLFAKQSLSKVGL
jgi:hypothetical protein